MGSDQREGGYVPNKAYSQADWDEVADSPELTDEQLQQGRPLVQTRPTLVQALLRRRGTQRAPTKALLSLRVDRDVLQAFRSSGPGWQVRMNEALRRAAGL